MMLETSKQGINVFIKNTILVATARKAELISFIALHLPGKDFSGSILLMSICISALRKFAYNFPFCFNRCIFYKNAN